MTLFLKELDCNVTISYEGAFEGQYKVKLNDVHFLDLPEFKEEVQVPAVGHSVIEEFNGAHTKRIDFLVFLEGRRTLVSV